MRIDTGIDLYKLIDAGMQGGEGLRLSSNVILSGSGFPGE